MKKISSQQQINIKELRRKGYSYKEISKRFKISKATSYKYCKNINVSKEGLSRLKIKEEKNIKRFIERFATAREVREPKEFSLSLVRIMSHCLFDGCVKGDGVIYSNASIELIEEFRKDMKEVFGVSPILIKEIRKITPYWMVYYNYKKISDFLRRFSLSYSTSSSEAIIPSFLFNSNTDIISEYLRCFWDDEGAVKCNGDVTGKTKSNKIANKLVKLHSKLGIDIRKYFDTKNLAYELYVIRGLNLRHFKERIGFKYGIVCRGKFMGLKKSEVLNTMLK